MSELPSSVRYVKNGRGGCWWKSAQTNGQIHAGWKSIPDALLLEKDSPAIEQLLKRQYGDRPGARQDFNQLRYLLETPSQHLWVTFEDDFVWWCTVNDNVTTNPDGESASSGHFWLTCARSWSNASLTGRILATSELPGTVTSTAGFRATVCTPKDWEAILRLIKGKTDKDAIDSADSRRDYELAVHKIVQRLSPQDFEALIDLILARTGWERIATLGGVREGLDVEAENPAAGEIAFVQVKSSADQHVLDDYVHRFQQRRERYARMIFAVHSPRGRLTAPRELPVQVWTGEKVAELVFPRIYTVCDFRASAALGQRDLSSLRYYLAYLAACSWMAASYGVSLREFDRANWQWSKERSKSEACQCRDAYTTYTPEVEAAAR